MDSPGGAGTVPLPPSSQVVGIMPPGFQFLAAAPQPDIIIPVRLDPARQAHGIYSWQMLARLKPGVTLTEAQADLDRMRPIWVDAWPLFPGMTAEQFANWRLAAVVHPLKDDLVGGVSSMLWVLMGAIGAVLLIACANIANLMLVRADARRPEFAVRAALGAMPRRIARELLVESLVLGAAGSVLGLVLAYAGLRALVAIGPSDLPRLQEIAVYPPVLAFSVAHFAGLGARVRLDHGTEACAAHRHACDRRRARVEREPRAERDAQHAGRRAGGAGASCWS